MGHVGETEERRQFRPVLVRRGGVGVPGGEAVDQAGGVRTRSVTGNYAER